MFVSSVLLLYSRGAPGQPGRPPQAEGLPHYGASQRPDSAERNSASMTAMFLMASTSGTGTSPSPRTACENKSPWMVYWSQTGNVSVWMPAPNRSEPSSTKMRQGWSFPASRFRRAEQRIDDGHVPDGVNERHRHFAIRN